MYRTIDIDHNGVTYTFREAVGMDVLTRSRVQVAIPERNNADDAFALWYFTRIIAQNLTEDSIIPKPMDGAARFNEFWETLLLTPENEQLAAKMVGAIDTLYTMTEKGLEPADKLDPNS